MLFVDFLGEETLKLPELILHLLVRAYAFSVLSLIALSADRGVRQVPHARFDARDERA